MHANTQSRFSDPKGLGYAKDLGLPSPEKAAQCTVCHQPMAAVPKENFLGTWKPNVSVSCETCHGPAEKWLRSHARPDFTHAQRLALGMHPLDTSYQRANTCVACHGVVPDSIRKVGHPAPRFELARQLVKMPPHWDDFDATQAASAWLAGQAVMLRELCWQTEKGNDQKERIESLHWLLRETSLGAEHLPQDTAPGPLREAADKLAKAASASRWSEKKTRSLFEQVTQLGKDVRTAPPEKQFARASVIAPALEGIATGLATKPGVEAEGAVSALRIATRAATTFNAETFTAAVEKLSSVVLK